MRYELRKKLTGFSRASVSNPATSCRNYFCRFWKAHPSKRKTTFWAAGPIFSRLLRLARTSFRAADILKQLTPADVELLDWLSDQPPKLDHGVLRVMATCGDARRALGWKLRRLALIVDNLIRHRVLGLGALVVDDMGQEEYLVNDGRELVFTTLGEAFIEACTRPEEPGPKKEE